MIKSPDDVHVYSWTDVPIAPLETQAVQWVAYHAQDKWDFGDRVRLTHRRSPELFDFDVWIAPRGLTIKQSIVYINRGRPEWFPLICLGELDRRGFVPREAGEEPLRKLHQAIARGVIR